MIGGGASYVAGQFGQGIQLTVGQYIQAPPINNGVAGAYTVSLWMDVPSANNAQGWHSICSTRDGAVNLGATEIAYGDPAGGGPAIHIDTWTNQGWGFSGTVSTPGLTPDAWHFVAATFQTGSLNLYVDGSLVANESFTGDLGVFGATAIPIMTPENEPFLIGWSGYGGADFNGSMDDFNVYNHALTANQLQRMYTVGNPQIIIGGSLPSKTPVQLAHGATFDLNRLPQAIDSLSDSGGSGGTVTSSVSGSITLTLAPAGTTTFSGVIQDGAGQISVTTNGPGIQVFSGSNTYTGATTVNGGMLEIAAPGVYSGGFALNGGTLEVGGPGVIDSNSLSGSGTILLAAGGSMIAKNFANNVVVAGGTLSGTPGATATVGGLLFSAGAVSLSDGQTIAVGNAGLIIAPGAGATFTMTGGSLAQGGFGAGANWWGGSVNVGDPSAGGPGGASNPAVLNISGGTLQAGNWSSGVAGAGLQVGVGGAAGIVNQSGGFVNVEGWDAFAVGGAIFGGTPGQGTYNLSAGTLNTGYYGNGYTEIGVAGGTGLMRVSGGVWNISADAPISPGSGGGEGGLSLLNIGSGHAPNYDAAGTGSVVISGGQVNAFGGITIGNVYNQGGVGWLSLQGGVLDLTAGTAGAFGGKILVGSGGTLAATSGTLQNVTEILGNVTISGTTASGTPMALTKSDTGLLVLAGTNTYTGGTTVSSGTLDFSTPAATPSAGIVTVNPGGYVVLGALSGASSPAIETTETVTDSSETVVTTSSARAGGAAATGGGASLGGTGSMAAGVSAGTVPEPSTFVLLGVAAIGLAGYVWRRKR